MEAPSSADTRSSPPLNALRVSNSNRSLLLKLIVNGVGHSEESITVTTRADDEVPVMVDDEVNHSVCSKRENSDEDIAILTLCKPLMFSKGKYQFKRSSLFYSQYSPSCGTSLSARHRPGLQRSPASKYLVLQDMP